MRLRLFVRPWSSSSKKRILFLGTDEFSQASLSAVKDHVPHESLEVAYAESGRSRHLLRDYAHQQGLRTHVWPCPDLKKNDFDLGVVASFGYLLPKKFIAKFPLGIINVHGSLLPRWRGASPVVYSILHGDVQTGVTIMNVAPHKFDKGDILATSSCPIDPDITSRELLSRLAVLGGELLVKVLTDYDKYRDEAIAQTDIQATSAPLIKSRELFYVQWESSSARQIYNQWRALNDIDRLRTTWKKTQTGDPPLIIRLSKERPSLLSEIPIHWVPWAKKNSTCVRPGAVIYLQSHNALAVKAREDWILFPKIMVGKKTLTARDFYNGYLNSHQHPVYFY